MWDTGDPTTCAVELRCRQWRVQGQVQGVGFRPFVHRLATRLGLAGTVRNDPSSVTIRAYGPPDRLDEFAVRLRQDAPALARIDRILPTLDRPASEVPSSFHIIASSHDSTERGRVTIDAAVCGDCVRELFNPADRRYRHGLINCTACGPRFTIVRDLPYDRARTTMAAFAMCERCAAEYKDPSNRRFHAQPTCCPKCGPRIVLTDGAGRPW
ncbi:MAG TPA: carbamoyltransferase HypF, partial [Planctomycetaceae bacterium]|nr:carbamoyltransferase HypF [Planctomycetaceae bacterium]